MLEGLNAAGPFSSGLQPHRGEKLSPTPVFDDGSGDDPCYEMSIRVVELAVSFQQHA